MIPKFIVILRDFPFNSALFGVGNTMTPVLSKNFTQGPPPHHHQKKTGLFLGVYGKTTVRRFNKDMESLELVSLIEILGPFSEDVVSWKLSELRNLGNNSTEF